MTEFLRNIPKPKKKTYDMNENEISPKQINTKDETKKQCYQYLKRQQLRISCNSDFQDGGAYPEIHINQYPNNMGLNTKDGKEKKNLVLKYIDENNNVKYDNLINESIHIYNNNIDMIETNESIKKLRKKKILSQAEDRDEKYNDAIYKPSEKEEMEIIENTKKNIENIINEKINKNCINNKKEDKYYRYIPQNKLNNNLEERIIKVVEQSTDPLDVSKFKNKKLPNIKNSPNYPILRSPTRKLTKEEEKEWQLPPCVSNWKNNKGYNIALDKRIQSDYKKLNNLEINQKFAHLSEYLYVAEKKAREEIKMRNNIIKQKKLKEKEKKEDMLRNLAIQARKEKGNTQSSIINDRKRELEKEYKIEKNLKKIKNYQNRHIEEQIALNKVNVNKNTNIHDISLFNINNDNNNNSNLHDNEEYQIYDTSLFDNKHSTNIYKFSKERVNKTLQKIETSKNAEPIKFVKDTLDPFGLDSLLSQAKKNNYHSFL